MLINYWSSNVNSGIKAIIYNNVGDIFFVIGLVVLYDYVALCYYVVVTIILLLLLLNLVYVLFYVSIYLGIVIVIIYANSAQLSVSWLLNAMTAATPVSALLHSSTMVIAGVYLGIGLQAILLIILGNSVSVSVLGVLGIFVSLVYSLLTSICTNDIKSIIACSTISQLSYMFLGVLIGVAVTIFHMIIHALFKSLLFLFSGYLISSEINQQSVSSLSLNDIFSYVSFLSLLFIMVITISKEWIIVLYYYVCEGLYVVGLWGGLLTIIYSISLIVYCFSYNVISFSHSARLSGIIVSLGSFVLVLLFAVISSVWLDELVEYIFGYGVCDYLGINLNISDYKSISLLSYMVMLILAFSSIEYIWYWCIELVTIFSYVS